MVEETGGEHRPRCAPLPTSPRWGEESETVVFYEKPPLVSPEGEGAKQTYLNGALALYDGVTQAQ